MEADKLNSGTVDGKFIVCASHHVDDPISKACTKSLQQIAENQLPFNVSNNGKF